MIPENFKMENRIPAKKILTFPVNQQSFQVHDLFMEFVSTTGKRFWQSTSYVRFTTDTLSRTSSLNDSKCYRCAVPVLVSTGRLVARGEERTGSTTTMPMSERRPSTMNSFLPAEIPLNSMAGQQRPQISELQFGTFPTLSTFSCWKIRFKTQASSCSDFHSEAMLWVKEVEMVDSLDDLKSSRAIEGKDFPNFRMLDARIASALNNIIQNSHNKKKVSLEEQEAQKEDRFLLRRQIAFMIYDYFRVSGAHATVLDYADLFSITLRNDNVQEFDTR